MQARTRTGYILAYIVLIGVAYLLMPKHVDRWLSKHLGEKNSAEQNMMGWTELTLAQADVKANPDGIWTWAYEYIEGPALLKIVADPPTAMWEYAPGKKCTADGDRNPSTQARNCIMPDAPVGALIAKIGGSTAGLKDGKVYLVGCMAILSLDQNTSGPLYFTINTTTGGMKDNKDALRVRVFITVPPSGSGGASPPSGSGGAGSAAAAPSAKPESGADSAADKAH